VEERAETRLRNSDRRGGGCGVAHIPNHCRSQCTFDGGGRGLGSADRVVVRRRLRGDRGGGCIHGGRGVGAGRGRQGWRSFKQSGPIAAAADPGGGNAAGMRKDGPRRGGGRRGRRCRRRGGQRGGRLGVQEVAALVHALGLLPKATREDVGQRLQLLLDGT